jgi:hypothetical protein
VPIFHGGKDIKENKLIGTLTAVGCRCFRRVSSISEVFELYPLDHSAVLDIEAGDNPYPLHQVFIIVSSHAKFNSRNT